MLSIVFSSGAAESTRVSKIYFQGNKSFSAKSLKKVLSTKQKDIFYDIYVDKDIENLMVFYNEQGFPITEVTSNITSQPKGKIIYFNINEGSRIKISSIKTSGNRAFSQKKLLSLIKLTNGDYLIKNKIDEAEKAIITWYKNSGYPYIAIERNISVDNNYAAINFSIAEGNLAYIKELKVRGNQKVSNQVILRTTQLKAGQKFSLITLEKARQQLYATKLFERVSFYVLDTLETDSLAIRFDVLELLPHEIGFGLGVQTPPTRLLISSNWINYNFLSRGQNLFFSGNYTPTFSRDWLVEFKSIYSIFYIFNTSLNFTLQPSFNYEVIDTTKRSELSVQAGLARYFGLKSEIGTYLQYQQVWTTPQVISTQFNSITNSQNFYIRYDTRDNLFTPEQGIFLSTNLQIAGSVFDGDNDFYKTQTELILFHKLLAKLIFGGRWMFGIAIPYGRTDHVPYFDEFSIGGYSGLRGYNEKALGPDTVDGAHYGEAVSNLNLELRTHFEKLIDFVIFSDIGKVVERNDITDLSPKTYQYGAGVGIRVNTPLGPIRFDYAKRLKEAPTDDWGKIYFGLLNAF
jgi:outer membrane protein insertion porin family